MNTRHFILSLTAAVVCSLTSFANAQAGPNGDVPKITVSLADLDVSKPAGANVLYGRIRGAARAVCGLYDSRLLVMIALSRACYRSAVDNAVAQINQPLLTAVHERTIGQQVEVVRTAER